MRIALALIVAVPLLWSSGCTFSGGEAHFIYGSNLDIPGPNLLIWPIDPDGMAFRRTTQPGSGLHMRSEGHVFTMPNTEGWRMAGDVELEGAVVILPPEPGPDLRERASEVAGGLCRAYPRASIHLLKTRIQPYDITLVSELEARLKSAWFEHMGSRSPIWGDFFVNGFRMSMAEISLAEFGIVPLAGDSIRYAVFAPSFEKGQRGMVIREAGEANLVDVLRELAAERRASLEAIEESGDDLVPGESLVRTGRVRAVLPRGAPAEVRRALESALIELQRDPVPGESTGDPETALPGAMAPWQTAEGLELRFATTIEWGDQKTIHDVDQDGLAWLLLYFSP